MKACFTWALRPQARVGGLGVSDLGFVINRPDFEKRNLVAILSLLTHSSNQSFYQRIDNNLAGQVLDNKRIFFKDEAATDIKQYFREGIEFIDRNIGTGNVLVHCAHGRSRSPTMAVAYMMFKRRIPLEDALGILTSQCDIISPNEGFLRQLKEFEQELGIGEPEF